MVFTYMLEHLNKPVTAVDFLAMFYYSPKKMKELFINQLFLVNNDVATKNTIIHPFDVIEIKFDEERDFLPSKKLPTVLYEDEFILAVEKPADMIIYDGETNRIDTLNNQISAYYKSKNIQAKIRHIHRLDKGTTGIVLYAKNPLAHAYFNEIWATNNIVKTYTAITEGALKEAKGIIHLPIGKDRHKNNHYLVLASGKPAITTYQVREHFKDCELVECVLETGRTHQIRVHLSHLAHPIVGDLQYNAKMHSERFFLHASEIKWVHPLTFETITVTSKLPKDMTEFIEKRGFHEN